MLYFSTVIIRVTKSRIMRWAGHVARMEKRRSAYSVLVGKPRGRDDLEDLDVNGSIMLKWILNKLQDLCIIQSNTTQFFL